MTRWIVFLSLCCVAACARHAPLAPPPPPPAAPLPPEPPPPPPAPVRPPSRGAAPTPAPAPGGVTSEESPAVAPTCLNGSVRTAGAADIPVARAQVTVSSEGATLAELMTRDDGAFSWCATSPAPGSVLNLTVRVLKAQFEPIEKNVSLTVGKATALVFTLEARLE